MSKDRDSSGRFPPGKSGNPSGRPKKPRGIDAELAKAAGERVPVVEQGKTKHMSKSEIAVTQLVNAAAAGDRPSIKLIMEVVRKVEERAEAEAARAPVMTQSDHEIAARVIARLTHIIREGNADENADA